MSWFVNFYRSAIGKKAVMALTGVILFGWVTAHMLGNMKLYLGESHFNEYAAWLRVMGSPAMPHSTMLWVARAVLVLCVGFHIHAMVMLTLMNRRARPVGYTDRRYEASSWASRTMRWGGVLIVIFIVYHLLHLTFGTLHPSYQENNPYHNVVSGFQVVWVALFYIVAQVALGLHLYHGLWSMFQSLGLNTPKFNGWRRTFATAFALLVSLANISFPVAVLAGWVR